MQKSLLLKIINPAVGIVFLLQALSGIFQSIIPYEIFHAFHGPLGWLLTGFIVCHIYLNWQWIVSTYFKKKPKTKK
jgi:hypothetical protein